MFEKDLGRKEAAATSAFAMRVDAPSRQRTVKGGWSDKKQRTVTHSRTSHHLKAPQPDFTTSLCREGGC
jgi:hypothetical protein